jgi:hypothetical protein
VSPGQAGAGGAGFLPPSDGGGFMPPYARTALSLYPARWRERYGAEYEALLADLTAQMSPPSDGGARGPHSDGGGRWRRWAAHGRLAASIVSGAVDARLHSSPGAGRTATPDRIRGAVGVAACAVVAFCIAGAGYQKMTEGPAFTAARHQHPVVGASFFVLAAAALLAGLAVAAGGLPILALAARQAIAQRRADLAALLAAPPLAALAWVAAVRIAAGLAGRGPVHATPNLAGVSVIGVLGLAVALVWAGCGVALLRRADLPDGLLRAERIPMALLTASMAAVTIADLTWGLALRAASPALFRSDNGLIATAMPPSWIAGVGVLAVVTAVTAAATVRAFRGPGGKARQAA